MTQQRFYPCGIISCNQAVREAYFCMICERCPSHCACGWKKVPEEPEEFEPLELEIEICPGCSEGFEPFVLCEKCHKCPTCCKH